MKSKTTSLWFVLAALLFAFIWFFQKYLQPAAPVVASLLPGLRANAVSAIQVSPAGALEISVIHTNGAWQMERPLAYPAQTAAIEALAGALEKLVPATRLAAAEMRGHTNADAEFGFDNPQFRLAVTADGQRRQLIIGNKTAPGDQVFIRVVGVDGAFVTDAGWLQSLPRTANDWRDTTVMDAASACDWMVITNGGRAMEFRRDPATRLWRMVRPWSARADGARLATALEQLRAGRIAQFVTDNPPADLGSYGLQPPELEVWLGQRTNLIAGVQAGKTLPDNPALVYARRAGWNTVVAASKDAFAGFRGSVNDYRDPHLFTLTVPVTEIEVRGEDNFILQQRGPNDWIVAGEKFPGDTEKVQALIKLLAGFRISEFVKDVTTPKDLQGFGLAAPARQIILRATADGTNSVLAQLQFGTSETNRVFVKRADEEFVYALKPEDVAQLPEHSWEFRDRRIWNFSETNLAQVTMRQNGKTRQLVRAGDNKWAFASGSQGIVNQKDIEETLRRLGELTAEGWVADNVTEPEKYGLNPNNLSITVELKTGEKLNLDFGLELPQSQTALAVVTLDGRRWAFVMQPVLYQFIATFLTIPPNAP